MVDASVALLFWPSDGERDGMYNLEFTRPSAFQGPLPELEHFWRESADLRELELRESIARRIVIIDEELLRTAHK